MAGLYLHIPFCKQACHYCNFHFSTSLKYKDELLDALIKEIELQANFLQQAPLESVYLGGGTPSLLNADELNRLFDKISSIHTIQPNAEITLEANPDDLQKDSLQALRQTPINRLSIGIQSFADADLQFMNRAHNAKEAAYCIPLAQDLGFTNLTIDLIYGSPTTTDEQWLLNLQTVFSREVPHLSCYALTVEDRTALAHFVKTGKSPRPDDEAAARQFDLLMEQTAKQGYDHYEISNFAKPDYYAIHNSNYWKGIPYLGIGPSAHSFDGQNRQWNIAQNIKYIQALEKDTIPFEQEILSQSDRYNEFVMTGFRTIWGVEKNTLSSKYSEFQNHFLTNIQPFLYQGLIKETPDRFILTQSGKHLADRIASDLFYLGN
jgi:oxygen-independent coproporphyrinogen-3 oxidase